MARGRPAFAQAQSEAQQQQQRAARSAGQQRAGLARGAQGRQPGELHQHQGPRGQRAGAVRPANTWRQIRNGPITFYGGWLVVLVALAMAAIYFAKGPIKLHDKPTGRMIERFTPGRALGALGDGHQLRGARRHRASIIAVRQARAAAGDRLHAVRLAHRRWRRTCTTSSRRCSSSSLLVFIVMFIKDNLPEKGDLQLARSRPGGCSSGEHMPSGRFNAGEKVWFWVGVVVLSLILCVTGAGPAVPELRPGARHDAAGERGARGRGDAGDRRSRSATSTWARSASKAPTATCATASRTRPGPRSTTSTGTTTSSRGAKPAPGGAVAGRRSPSMKEKP